MKSPAPQNVQHSLATQARAQPCPAHPRLDPLQDAGSPGLGPVTPVYIWARLPPRAPLLEGLSITSSFRNKLFFHRLRVRKKKPGAGLGLRFKGAKSSSLGTAQNLICNPWDPPPVHPTLAQGVSWSPSLGGLTPHRPTTISSLVGRPPLSSNPPGVNGEEGPSFRPLRAGVEGMGGWSPR